MAETYVLENSSSLSISGVSNSHILIMSPGNCKRSFTVKNGSDLTLADLKLEFKSDCSCMTAAYNCNNGGLIHVSEASSLGVTRVQFVSGSALKGGCIFSEGSRSDPLSPSITIDLSDFTSCYAKQDGGSIYVAAQQSVQLSSTTLETNDAFGKGGAVYIADGGTVSLLNTLNKFGDNTDPSKDNQANQGKQIMKEAGGILKFEEFVDCPPGTEVDNALSDSNAYAMERPFTGCKTIITFIKCELGKYTTAIDAWTFDRTCSNCPDGRFSNVEGLCDHQNPTEQNTDLPPGPCACQMCPVGRQSRFDDSARTSCEECGTGKFNDEIGIAYDDCKNCQAGRYNSETGKGTCSLCGEGKYSTETEANDASQCKNCPAGFYSTEQGSATNNCIMCDAGFYSTNDGLTGKGDCSNCEIGKFRNTQHTDPTVCVKCPKGRYNNEEREDTACKICPAGRYYGLEGAESLETCKECGEGTYLDDDGTNVELHDSEEDCKNCAAGTYQSEEGKTSDDDCIDCVTGQYGNEDGKSSCVDCPAGFYENGAGSTDCKGCPTGMYLDEEGSTSQNDCHECPRGKYEDETGQYMCKNCVRSTYSDQTGNTSDSACKLCPPGKQAKDGNGTARPGMTYCTLCPIGYYKANFMNEIGDYCEFCPSESNQTGRTQCPGCEIGEFGYNTGCQYAPVTTALPANESCRDSEPCTPCPSGWFSGAGDKLECTMCPKGYYSNRTKSNKCDACSVGKYGTWANMEVEKYEYRVPVNKSGTVYRENLQPIMRSSGKGPALFEEWTCIACGAGLFGTVSGNSEDTYLDRGGPGGCISCPQGKWSNISIAQQESSCIPCVAGRFDHQINGGRMGECEKCPAGFFMTSSGSSYCDPCPAGKFGTDDNYCGPCPSGYYQTEIAKQNCPQCEAGFYSDSDNSVSCTSCSSGFYQVELAKAGCLPW